MLRVIATTILAASALVGPALAETHDVQMLNRGEAGIMVFKPDFLRIAKGDTVKFIAADPGHNAESIPELMPGGSKPFKGGINEEIEVTFDVDRLYGVKCLPHCAMGMAMTIAVGDVTEVPQDYLKGRIPPGALKRFEEQLSNL